MKYKYILLLALAVISSTDMLAQRKKKQVVEEVKPDTAQVVKNYLDSLTVLRRQLDSLQQVNTQLRTEVSDGRYFRLFAPTTFYHSGANKMLSMSPATGDEVTDAVDAAMMNLYMRRPDLVKNNETQLKEVGSIREDVNQELTQKVDLVKMAAPVPEEQEAVPVAVVIKKPNFWKFKGDGYLQFLQNYVTDNWHKGEIGRAHV